MNTCLLGDAISSIRSGFASGKRCEDGIVQLRMNNVRTDGTLDLTSFIRVPTTEKQVSELSLVNGDVLFNCTNSPELVGKTCLFKSFPEPVVFSNHFIRLRTRPEILLGDYLARWLAWTREKGVFTHGCIKWVNQATFKKDDLLKLRIPLPPLAEQRRIAGILDAADALRAKRRESLAQLDTLLQSTFLDMFGDPVTNPKGWDRRTLGEIINFVGGSQPPKTTFTYEPSEGTVRLVQIRDFKSDRFKTYIPEDLARRRFDSDDVMIARYGPPVFQILRGLSGSYNVALMKAEPIGKIEKLFIFHLLSHPAINNAVVARSVRTAGQTGVNLQFLNKYPAYLPPLELQHRFAAIVESVEQQRASQRTHLDELDNLIASLQSRAFRGDL